MERKNNRYIHLLWIVFGLLLCTGVKAQVGEYGFYESQLLQAPSPASRDFFGSKVDAIGDSLALVSSQGADEGIGAAYIMHKNASTGDVWQIAQKLTIPDAEQGDRLGNQVVLSANFAFVAASGQSAGSQVSGVLHVFQRNPSNPQEWEYYKAISEDPPVYFGLFGIRLAYSATHDLLAVANTRETVSIYAKDQGGTDNWGLLTTLSGAENTGFGSALSFSGDRLAIGADNESIDYTDQGKAYIYTYNAGSQSFALSAELVAFSPSSNAQFGSDVSLNGSQLVVTASTESSVYQNAGASYIFEESSFGANDWTETRKIILPNLEQGEYSGQRAIINGDDLFINASSRTIDCDEGRGILYHYRKQGGTWSLNQPIMGSGTGTKSYFSADISLFGNTLFVSADARIGGADVRPGTLYVLERNFVEPIRYAGFSKMSINGVTGFGANFSSAVSSSGGGTVSDKGVVLSTQPSPTICDTLISAGEGTGTIEVEASGLAAETTYYVRTFAITEAGEVYDNALSFTTDSAGEFDFALDNNSVEENVPAESLVGTFRLNYPMSTSYSLIEGEGDTDNADFTITTADELLINERPDFEAQSSYSIRVLATLENGIELEKIISVEVSNVNEAPTSISFSTSEISSNFEGGVLGTLSAQDPDNLGDIRFYFNEGANDNDFFLIEGNEVIARNNFSTYGREAITLQIAAVDVFGDGLRIDGTFVVRIVSPPDADGDGILDADDNCPFIFNPAQTDENDNGIGDVCEDSDLPDCETSTMGSNLRWDGQFRQPGAAGGATEVLVSDENYLYASGTYTLAFGGDYLIRGLARFDGIKWEQLGGDFKCTSCGTGYRNAMAQDQAGNIYVGGAFEGAFNNDGSYVESSNIIKWNIETEQWEPLGLGVGSNRVYDIELRDNYVYVGGRISQAFNADEATIAIKGVARFNLETQEWEDLDGGIECRNSGPTVNDLEFGVDGELFVSGSNLDSAGTGENKIAAYSIASWKEGRGWDNLNGGLPFFNTLSDDSTAYTVFDVRYNPANELVYAVGYFRVYNDPARQYFASWNGESWQYIAGFTDVGPKSLFLDEAENHLYIGGSFEEEFGNGITRYDPQNGTFTALGGGITANEVRDMVFYKEELYAAGSISAVAGQQAYGIVKWDGESWGNLGNGIYSSGGTFNEIVSYQGAVYGGGVFSAIDGQNIYGLAKWTPNGGWEPFGGGVYGSTTSNYSGVVHDLKIHNGELLVAGDFERIGSTNVSGLGAVDLETGNVRVLGASGITGSGSPRVYAVEVFQNEVYIGGIFTGVDGVSTANLAKFNGETWESVGTVSSTVYALQNADDNILYAGGFFDEIEGQSFEHVAGWDGSSWSALGQGITTFNVNVYDFDYYDNTLYIGGQFNEVTQADGTQLAVSNLVKWNGTEWEAFEALSLNDQINKVYYDSAFQVLYVGGEFTTLNDQTYNRIARYSENAGWGAFGDGVRRASSSTSGASVSGITRMENYLYIAGDFRVAGDKQASKFTRYALENNAFNPAIMLDLGDDIVKCAADIAYLKVEGDFTRVVWSTGVEADSIGVLEEGTYWVEVFNSFGCSKTDTLQVTNTTFSIDLGEDISQCESESVVLDLDQTYANYLWSTGATSPQITVSESGEYYVTVTNESGCTATDTIQVALNGNIFIDLGEDLSFCSAQTVILDAGSGFASYSWSTGETTQQIEVTESGTYSIEVSSQSGCIGEDTIEVVIDNSFFVDLGDTIQSCAGDTVRLSTNAEGMYLWSTGAESEAIDVTTDGTYALQVTNEEGCTATDSVQVLFTEAPVAEISSYGFIISASEGAHYTWYFNGDILPDSTQNIIAREVGTYQVMVSSEYGCGGLSETHEVFITQTDKMVLEQVRFYPNPVEGHLTLEVPEKYQQGHLQVQTVSGKIVHQQLIEQAQWFIDTSSWPEGMLFMTLIKGKESAHFKITRK